MLGPESYYLFMWWNIYIYIYTHTDEHNEKHDKRPMHQRCIKFGESYTQLMKRLSNFVIKYPIKGKEKLNKNNTLKGYLSDRIDDHNSK